MKLQRYFAYTYNGKRHHKNVITIPDDIINQVGWNIGDEIRIAVKENRLLLEATPTPMKKRHFSLTRNS